jgi:IclR family pca regulon transcriptional regulator
MRIISEKRGLHWVAYSMVYGLDLVRFLAAQQRPVSIGEIVEGTGIARATAYRAVDELIKAGYMSAIGSPRRFSATWRVAQLGLLMLSNNHVREVALSNVLGLAAASGQLAFVSFVEGNETVFTDSAEVTGERVVVRSTGSRLPALTTSTGRAILAVTRSSEVEAIIAMGVPQATPFTKTLPEDVRAELECTRIAGFAVSDNEAIVGTVSIAAAVRNSIGDPVAAVGLSIRNQTGAEVAQRYGDLVQNWARKASTEMGYRTSTTIA